jgi:hypothetical protein
MKPNAEPFAYFHKVSVVYCTALLYNLYCSGLYCTALQQVIVICNSVYSAHLV